MTDLKVFKKHQDKFFKKNNKEKATLELALVLDPKKQTELMLAAIDKRFIADDKIVKYQLANGKKVTKHQNMFYLVATNKWSFETEFNNQFTALKERNELSSPEQWFYLYYMCLMLKLYYQGYGQKRKEDDYDLLAKKIKERCLNGKFPESTSENESFLKYLWNKAVKETEQITNAPEPVADFRKKVVSYLNIVRLYWAFCRLFVTNGLRLARNTSIIDKLDKALGLHTDVDQIIDVLNGPNSIFRALSIGFFVARILLNSASVIKHTCFPSKLEESQTWQERLTFEMKKRGFDYINDIVWAAINGVTNYNTFFHVTAASAGYITAGFLMFDIMLIMCRLLVARKRFLDKEKQYLDEIIHHRRLLAQEEDNSQAKVDLDIAERKLNDLRLTFATESYTYMFNAFAATLLFAGFTASLFVTPLGALVACYAVCTLTAGLYLSGDAFSEWREKSVRLDNAKQQLELNRTKEGTREYVHLSNTMKLLDKEYIQARNDFIWTIAKNTIIPALTIAVFAVCWQAALVLVVGYLAYELYNAKQKKTVQEAIEAPVPEEKEELIGLAGLGAR